MTPFLGNRTAVGIVRAGAEEFLELPLDVGVIKR